MFYAINFLVLIFLFLRFLENYLTTPNPLIQGCETTAAKPGSCPWISTSLECRTWRPLQLSNQSKDTLVHFGCQPGHEEKLAATPQVVPCYGWSVSWWYIHVMGRPRDKTGYGFMLWSSWLLKPYQPPMLVATITVLPLPKPSGQGWRMPCSRRRLLRKSRSSRCPKKLNSRLVLFTVTLHVPHALFSQCLIENRFWSKHFFTPVWFDFSWSLPVSFTCQCLFGKKFLIETFVHSSLVWFFIVTLELLCKSLLLCNTYRVWLKTVFTWNIPQLFNPKVAKASCVPSR